MGCWCGTEARIDCTQMFGRKKCDPNSDPFELCVPAGTECDTIGDKDSCEGSTLVYCDDGYVTKSDCTALGFKSCVPHKVGSMVLGALCE